MIATSGAAVNQAKPRVFISFVNEDHDIADAIRWLLEHELVLHKRVFLSSDQRQIVAGADWFAQIREALHSCEVLLLLLSGRSLNRPWVNFEAGGVWLAGKPIIPVCIGNISKASLPQPYTSMQGVDLKKETSYLLRSVHKLLKLPGPEPASPLQRMVRAGQGGREQGVLATMLDPYDRLNTALLTWRDVPVTRS
jgi:hypothetical protein